MSSKKLNNGLHPLSYQERGLGGELDILEKESIIKAVRSSGPGGQHVNKSDTAIQIYHPRSGIRFKVSDTRSQYQNKMIALKRLQEKLIAKQKEAQKKLQKEKFKKKKKKRPKWLKEKILETKKRKSEKKQLRRKISDY